MQFRPSWKELSLTGRLVVTGVVVIVAIALARWLILGVFAALVVAALAIERFERRRR